MATDYEIPPADDPYWWCVREYASWINSDGCTGVADFYLDACLEHDYHYRTHRWLDGRPIFRSEADERFRRVIQSRSPFGRISPLSWWRWAGVRILGRHAWNANNW